jgi:hypothetical protein
MYGLNGREIGRRRDRLTQRPFLSNVAGSIILRDELPWMKKIGFLSFGHWTPSPQSQTRSAADTLLQSIDLAVAAEQLGADGAYFRVHHFARQLASPFPLLEIDTAVIDMRYETRCTWSRTPAPPI